MNYRFTLPVLKDGLFLILRRMHFSGGLQGVGESGCFLCKLQIVVHSVAQLATQISYPMNLLLNSS
jgi:hypothetical protein